MVDDDHLYFLDDTFEDAFVVDAIKTATDCIEQMSLFDDVVLLLL
jgi:hypothetical protein